ncbi:hypothetical protein OSTOST_00627 [Ostertagia ostertagi]
MLIVALGLLAAVAAYPSYSPPAQAPTYPNPPAQAPPAPAPRPVIYLPPTFNNPGPANVAGGADYAPFLDSFSGPFPPLNRPPFVLPYWMPPGPAYILPQQRPTYSQSSY